ncbi:hypothetical protein RIF29_03549 [Crotalaria pallida]|uniref:Uncharacterized protein n=1 Tax=Crotalaria pallida TaxID=3830 RepID=A0AAN9P9W3_CROPI
MLNLPQTSSAQLIVKDVDQSKSPKDRVNNNKIYGVTDVHSLRSPQSHTYHSTVEQWKLVHSLLLIISLLGNQPDMVYPESTHLV